MKMKKLISLILAVTMLLCASACGSSAAEPAAAPETAPAAAPAEEATPAPEPARDEGPAVQIVIPGTLTDGVYENAELGIGLRLDDIGFADKSAEWGREDELTNTGSVTTEQLKEAFSGKPGFADEGVFTDLLAGDSNRSLSVDIMYILTEKATLEEYLNSFFSDSFLDPEYRMLGGKIWLCRDRVVENEGGYPWVGRCYYQMNGGIVARISIDSTYADRDKGFAYIDECAAAFYPLAEEASPWSAGDGAVMSAVVEGPPVFAEEAAPEEEFVFIPGSIAGSVYTNDSVGIRINFGALGYKLSNEVDVFSINDGDGVRAKDTTEETVRALLEGGHAYFDLVAKPKSGLVGNIYLSVRPADGSELDAYIERIRAKSLSRNGGKEGFEQADFEMTTGGGTWIGFEQAVPNEAFGRVVSTSREICLYQLRGDKLLGLSIKGTFYSDKEYEQFLTTLKKNVS